MVLLLKLEAGKVKCLSTSKAFGSFTSFLWLFKQILKVVSLLPTYWELHKLHSNKYITYLLLQLILWNILNVRLVWFLLNDTDANCLQQSILVLANHGKHLPLSLLSDLTSFLLCSVVLLPIICWRFVSLQKAMSCDDWNISLNSGLTCKTCHCFASNDLIFGEVWLLIVCDWNWDITFYFLWSFF